MTRSFESFNPGRECQAVGTANFLGQDPANIHESTFAVIGTGGDSQCYLGVSSKVNAIQEALGRSINRLQLPFRLLAPAYVNGVSDGQLNGTDRMRFSLIGREAANDGTTLHLSGSDTKGTIAVVACDKPPVGVVAALAEHNQPAIIMSDGSIRPGRDPLTGDAIDIVSCFQVAGDKDADKRARYALNACPGYGSCGGMFTYNTMQSFIAVAGMEPLDMVSPASDDPRRLNEFPDRLVQYLQVLSANDIKPRDILTPAAFKNAMTVAIAMGGSTNVLLHGPEIARAAGLDFWKDVMSQDEFNKLSREVPVLTNARPYGKYSMVNLEEVGGLPVVVDELFRNGLLNGDCITCTGDTLAKQLSMLRPRRPDGEIIYSFDKPFKENGGLRVLKGNLAPDGGAVIKVAGVEGGIEDGVFQGNARTFNSEAQLLQTLTTNPDVFQDKDVVVIRYEGPKGAPGMPEMLDPTSRLTTICRERGITIGFITDARFSGGSVGLVVGHVGPEAYDGGPIALVENGDQVVINLNTDSIDCVQLENPEVSSQRKAKWEQEVQENNGTHPAIKPISNRLLRRMRATASTPLKGAGMSV